MRRSLVLATLFAAPHVLAGQAIDRRSLPAEVADEVLAAFDEGTARHVEGPFRLDADQTVRGNLTVRGGLLTLAGRVTGKVVAVDADVELLSGAVIEGDLLMVGGTLTGRDVGRVVGTIRLYAARGARMREADERTTRPERDRRGEGARDERDDGAWWRRPDRWRESGWTDLRFISARTYNRVEGLPVFAGPAFGKEFEWGRLSIEALGAIRSADSFDWNSNNLGHSLKTELQLGHRHGVRVGAKHFDVVEPVESWGLSNAEVGLASFFLHRDYRDYYNTHGGTVYGSVFVNRDLDLGGSYSHQRWNARQTRDPWTLFRDGQAWRPNPMMDEGKLHLATATLTYDTRSDERRPWSGWSVSANYEYGTGRIDRYAPTTGARALNVDGATTYDRAFVDVRRYSRLSPGSQVNLRVVAGGWLSGDALPLQRRFSLGGPATLPGYDFRHFTASDAALLTCAGASPAGAAPVGMPAECERFALGQLELRWDLRLDPFGILDEDRHWRRRGWGRGTQWVLFADAGRGWRVGTPDRRTTYAKDEWPHLSTFRTDVGAGLLLDDVGLYVAKAVSTKGAPLNFFVRLRPRF